MVTTNNQEIETTKNHANRAVITSVTFHDKDNYVNFSDTDSQTDYFNGASLGINHVIDWMTKDFDASDIVKVTIANNDKEPKFYKRLTKLAKALRYKIKTVERKGIYRIYENEKECAINPYCYEEYFLYDSNKVREEEIIL